mmetsp:Transcript_67052/g.179226  ORF Transcript_67052/g.179226 Transcript_67052/m.179226 type:complete len:129 (+) Transcript_67052:135-521(+)
MELMGLANSKALGLKEADMKLLQAAIHSQHAHKHGEQRRHSRHSSNHMLPLSKKTVVVQVLHDGHHIAHCVLIFVQFRIMKARWALSQQMSSSCNLHFFSRSRNRSKRAGVNARLLAASAAATVSPNL